MEGDSINCGYRRIGSLTCGEFEENPQPFVVAGQAPKLTAGPAEENIPLVVQNTSDDDTGSLR